MIIPLRLWTISRMMLPTNLSCTVCNVGWSYFLSGALESELLRRLRGWCPCITSLRALLSYVQPLLFSLAFLSLPLSHSLSLPLPPLYLPFSLFPFSQSPKVTFTFQDKYLINTFTCFTISLIFVSFSFLRVCVCVCVWLVPPVIFSVRFIRQYVSFTKVSGSLIYFTDVKFRILNIHVIKFIPFHVTDMLWCTMPTMCSQVVRPFVHFKSLNTRVYTSLLLDGDEFFRDYSGLR